MMLFGKACLQSGIVFLKSSIITMMIFLLVHIPFFTSIIMLRFILITNLLLQDITYNVPPSWVPGRRHHAANTASAARELADLHAAHKAAMGMRLGFRV